MKICCGRLTQMGKTEAYTVSFYSKNSQLISGYAKQWTLRKTF